MQAGRMLGKEGIRNKYALHSNVVKTRSPVDFLWEWEEVAWQSAGGTWDCCRGADAGRVIW